jgi:trimeric autotransporter adhesin
MIFRRLCTMSGVSLLCTVVLPVAQGQLVWDDRFGSAGMNGTVFRTAAGASNVFAFGEFNLAGDTPALRAANWNGSAWQSLGSGIDGPISDAVTRGGELFVVGSFTSVGGVPATNVARWDGTMWTPVGSGLSGATAITVQGNDIYAAGAIIIPGTERVWNIVRWDGTQWVPVADGIGSSDPAFGWYRFITSIVALGDDLCVAGNFLTAGSLTVNHIARWTSEGWQPVGTGVLGSRRVEPNLFYLTYIDDLAVDGGNLYVGGSFTNAGGVAARNVAKWDGSKWSALASGLGNPGLFFAGYLFFPVGTLAAKNGILYAGGEFRGNAPYLARWDGKSWSATPGGVNSYIRALAANGDDLYVGGTQTSAGGRPSYYFGILHGAFLPSLWLERGASDLNVCWPAEATNYVLQATPAGIGPIWSDVAGQMQTSNGVKRLKVTPSSAQEFFRLRKVVEN